GLVHRSHMSSCRVDNPAELVDVGDRVWVKLIGKEVKDEKLKLSLSMKVVHQGTGKDLDPNNVSLDQDERKKRTFRNYTSQKITLEAVLNTVCKKCGCKGGSCCFLTALAQPGGDPCLIPEEEEEEEEEEVATAAGRGGDKKISQAEEPSKKRKKEKKKKKKQHKAEQSSESDSDSSASDSAGAQPPSKRPKHSGKPGKAAKKKKKHKKHRK
ncbi:NO40 protein, partial [Gymnorhina tibicen]|nr:NO40 protein [Gymnorhina tibicen]